MEDRAAERGIHGDLPSSQRGWRWNGTCVDGSGNEIVVLDGRLCVPKLMPTRQTVTLLSRMQTYQVGASLMARAGGLLKGKVDINGIVEGSKDKLVSFAANDVFTDRYETARWRAEILKLSPDSMCFKAMTSDKHMSWCPPGDRGQGRASALDRQERGWPEFYGRGIEARQCVAGPGGSG